MSPYAKEMNEEEKAFVRRLLAQGLSARKISEEMGNYERYRQFSHTAILRYKRKLDLSEELEKVSLLGQTPEEAARSSLPNAGQIQAEILRLQLVKKSHPAARESTVKTVLVAVKSLIARCQE